MLRKQTLMIFHYWVGTKFIYIKLKVCSALKSTPYISSIRPYK
jgi:hypothetical protein